MNKKQKKNLIRIAASAVLILVIGQLGLQGLPRLIAYLVPYLIVGYDILYKAGHGIVRRQPLDECLLMAVATLGALALAIYEDGDYTEAIAVMLFYQVGEWFQSYAIGKSRRDITELMDIRPDYANVAGENGALHRVDPDEVAVGTVITVQPGEKIPIDGVVVSGASALNTVALTGESLPRDVAAGDEVLSGCINVSGLLRIRTTKGFDESTASKILELVEDVLGFREHRGEVRVGRGDFLAPLGVFLGDRVPELGEGLGLQHSVRRVLPEPLAEVGNGAFGVGVLRLEELAQMGAGVDVRLVLEVPFLPEGVV